MFKSKLIFYLLEHRQALLELFDQMNNYELEGFGDAEENLTAGGFGAFLRQPQTVFLLYLFGMIFERTDQLYKVIQKKSMDISYCMETINESVKFFEDMRNSQFVHIWDKTENLPDVDRTQARRRGRPTTTPLSQKESFALLMANILNVLVDKLKTRFANFSAIKFAELFCCEKYSSYSEFGSESFPLEAFQTLKESYPDHFNFVKLKAELQVIYTNSSLKDKGLPELLLVLGTDKSLQDAFRESYKLCQLIYVLPSTSANAERVFSAMRRIKTYLRTTMTEERFSNISFLAVEKELVVQLHSQGQIFYDKVIEEFVKKDRRADFNFK
jgi:hAT family C-terminal dimerisation region